MKACVRVSGYRRYQLNCEKVWWPLLQWDTVSREYRLHSIQSEHKKTITAVAWCPFNVEVIVSASADLAIVIWNVTEQRVVSHLTLEEGVAIPCSVMWGMPNPSGIAFIGKRGPLMMCYSMDESEKYDKIATHSEIRGFSSDVCQMRCHERQRDKIALGHVDGSISIFATGRWLPCFSVHVFLQAYYAAGAVLAHKFSK